jgi:WD40 repeat protein
MKPISIAALGLVLSCQASAQAKGFDSRLAVNVTTKSGKVVEIKGPEVNLKPDPDLDYRWKTPTILPNQDSQFIAVHYYGSLSKYWDAMVYLVGPDGQLRRLKNGTVLNVQWTDDGKYLIGRGVNTLRLWNLNGGLRQVTFQDVRSFRYSKQKLCLNLNWYSPLTGQLSRTTEIQLAVPSLTQISDKETDGQATCGGRP